MIFLHKPYIKKQKDKARLYFDVEIGKEKKSIFFEVEKAYEKYLCDDRVDAIVVGLLSYAMRGKHNIESDSYITEELLYKIKNYLIPSLTKYSEELYPIEIKIKTKETIPNAGAVGTGCSLGVDSLHAYLNQGTSNPPQFKITHLCINDVGAFNETYQERGIEKVKEERYQKSREFAKEVGLPLIETESNFLNEIYQDHHLTHTYSSAFAILCLQKLWRTYYYGSSGIDFSSFNIVDTANHDCWEYELLSLQCFSTNNLTIYSEGAAKDRLEKTRSIYKNKLTKKYLHVCVKKEYNCGVCIKCMRTLLTLYALDANMKEYHKIFDIDYFLEHKEEYFEWILKEHLWSNTGINEPVYQLLLKKEEFQKFVEKYKREHKVEERSDWKTEYEKVIHSKTYKVGNLIMKVPRKIKSLCSRKGE